MILTFFIYSDCSEHAILFLHFCRAIAYGLLFHGNYLFWKYNTLYWLDLSCIQFCLTLLYHSQQHLVPNMVLNPIQFTSSPFQFDELTLTKISFYVSMIIYASSLRLSFYRANYRHHVGPFSHCKIPSICLSLVTLPNFRTLLPINILASSCCFRLRSSSAILTIAKSFSCYWFLYLRSIVIICSKSVANSFIYLRSISALFSNTWRYPRLTSSNCASPAYSIFSFSRSMSVTCGKLKMLVKYLIGEINYNSNKRRSLLAATKVL